MSQSINKTSRRIAGLYTDVQIVHLEIFNLEICETSAVGVSRKEKSHKQINCHPERPLFFDRDDDEAAANPDTDLRPDRTPIRRPPKLILAKRASFTSYLDEDDSEPVQLRNSEKVRIQSSRYLQL